MYGKVVHIHEFLTWAVGAAEWSTSRLTLLCQWREIPTEERRVAYRADLEAARNRTYLDLSGNRTQFFSIHA
jgi:hypothetical protein